jgi:hypothetical protein
VTVWAYVPGRTFEGYVNELPASAVRLDTGQRVTDVAKWAKACGYWDTSEPDALSVIAEAKNLTNAEFAALVAAAEEARDKRNDRRAYVEARRDEWLNAKGVFHDWLDRLPPYEVPDNGPMPTGPDTLATLRSQVLWMYGRLDPRNQYLYEHERRITEVLIPAIDFVFALAAALVVELEQSDTFHPPGTIFEMEP